MGTPSRPELLALHGVRLPGFADAGRIAAYARLPVCTRWQIRPQPWDRMAANDHTEGGPRRTRRVDAPDRASCHLVRIQLHEDLLATLGLERGTDGPGALD